MGAVTGGSVTWGSVTGGRVTGDVGKVTGNVGKVTGNVGKVTGNVGKVTGNVGKVTGNVGKVGKVGKVTGNVGRVTGNGGSVGGGPDDGAATAVNVLSGPGNNALSNAVATPQDLKSGIVNVPVNCEIDPGFAIPFRMTVIGVVETHDVPTRFIGGEPGNVGSGRVGNVTGSVGNVGGVGNVIGSVGTVMGSVDSVAEGSAAEPVPVEPERYALTMCMKNVAVSVTLPFLRSRRPLTGFTCVNSVVMLERPAKGSAKVTGGSLMLPLVAPVTMSIPPE